MVGVGIAGCDECGCADPCGCCKGRPVTITAAPKIFTPFIGPLASKDGGSFWFNPSLSNPSFADYYDTADTFALIECDALKPISLAVGDNFFGKGGTPPTQNFNGYYLAANGGISYLSTAAIVTSAPPTCPTSGFGGATSTIYGPDIRPHPLPDCSTSYRCYYSSPTLSGNSCGVNLPWKNPFTGVDHGTYLYQSRSIGNNYWSTRIFANGWIGRVDGYTDDPTKCYLHFAVRTETTWFPDWDTSYPSQSSGGGLPPIAALRFDMAYWRSDALEVDRCCEIGDPVTCYLVTSANRFLSQTFKYYGAEGNFDSLSWPFTHPDLFFWYSPAVIEPLATLEVYTGLDCTEPDEPPPEEETPPEEEGPPEEEAPPPGGGPP